MGRPLSLPPREFRLAENEVVSFSRVNAGGPNRDQLQIADSKSGVTKSIEFPEEFYKSAMLDEMFDVCALQAGEKKFAVIAVRDNSNIITTIRFQRLDKEEDPVDVKVAGSGWRDFLGARSTADGLIEGFFDNAHRNLYRVLLYGKAN